MADSISIKIKGAEKLKAKLKRIPPAVEVELRATIFEAATGVKNSIVAEIEKPKSGRIYKRRRRNKSWITWQASAPGEAPAKKTGQRMAQITVKKANRAGKPSSRIKAPGIYRLLENGTAKIAPRPLFGPIMRAYRHKFKDLIDGVVSRVLKVEIRK